MKKIINWFKESNRWKHLIGGAVIGALSNSWYCAILSSSVAGGAMEYKDYAKGGKADVIDFILTAVGGVVGHAVIIGIIQLFR